MCNIWIDFIKCTGAGLLLGAAIGAFFCCKAKACKKEDRSIKRKARKAVEAMEDMMGEVQDMFVRRD